MSKPINAATHFMKIKRPSITWRDTVPRQGMGPNGGIFYRPLVVTVSTIQLLLTIGTES